MVCRTHNYADGHKVVKDHFADGGHVYGAPIGRDEPDPNRKQTVPSAPTKEGIKAYQESAHAEAAARMKAKASAPKPAPAAKEAGKAVGVVKGIDAIINRKRDIEKGIEDAGG